MPFRQVLVLLNLVLGVNTRVPQTDQQGGTIGTIEFILCTESSRIGFLNAAESLALAIMAVKKSLRGSYPNEKV